VNNSKHCFYRFKVCRLEVKHIITEQSAKAIQFASFKLANTNNYPITRYFFTKVKGRQLPASRYHLTLKIKMKTRHILSDTQTKGKSVALHRTMLFIIVRKLKPLLQLHNSSHPAGIHPTNSLEVIPNMKSVHSAPTRQINRN
jgi:hypothetical protein